MHNPNFVVIFFKGSTFGQFWYVGTLQKFFWSSCGGPIFVGAPVRPNMLDMPKSASEHDWSALTLITSMHLRLRYLGIRVQ